MLSFDYVRIGDDRCETWWTLNARPTVRFRITDRALSALKAGQTLWDTEVAGLGARRRREDSRVAFVLKFRSPVEKDGTGRGRQRMVTIDRRGRGDYGIDAARKEATALRLQIRAGTDPALARDERKSAITIAELCALYMDALPTILIRGRAKKPSTIRSDRSNIERHILPLLGTLAVAAVTAADVRQTMHAIAVGKTAAARTTVGRKGAGSPSTVHRRALRETQGRERSSSRPSRA